MPLVFVCICESALFFRLTIIGQTDGRNFCSCFLCLCEREETRLAYGEGQRTDWGGSLTSRSTAMNRVLFYVYASNAISKLGYVGPGRFIVQWRLGFELRWCSSRWMHNSIISNTMQYCGGSLLSVMWDFTSLKWLEPFKLYNILFWKNIYVKN